MRKLLIVLGAAIAVALGTAAPATPVAAGGWVVVSFDATPEVVAGAPTTLGFTLLRHGVTLESSTDVSFVVTGSDGYRERFPAVPEGAVGHHVVTITVPVGGDYSWSAEGPFMPVELGALTIALEPRASESRSSMGWNVAQWGGTGLAVLLAIAAAVDATAGRRRRPGDAVAAEA